MSVQTVIHKFGGVSALARALNHRWPTTVSKWRKLGSIPSRHMPLIMERARELGIDLNWDDFFLKD